GVMIYKMFINGEWVESSNRQTFEVRNSYDNSVVGRVQKATREDALRAVEAAFAAKKSMEKMETVKRIELLEKIKELVDEHKNELVDMLIQESGKPRVYAEGEANATIERLHCAAEEVKTMHGEYIPGDLISGSSQKFAIVSRKPVGVVLAICPFNYPLFISVSKIAPAIAAGNSVVCKAASDDPITLLMFTRLAEMAGIPKGGLNVITGGGGEIGDLLASHQKIDMISFTGSTAVGKHIASIAGMKKLHLELGGKSPAIVLEDADMDTAVKECVAGALKFSGQRCDALSRILVVEAVADDFVKRVVKEVKGWKMGDPKDPETRIGPLINEQGLQKVDGLVKDAVSKGAKVIAGGKRVGNFYEPTVLDFVTKDMRIAWEETFGPVITIMRVKNIEDAIEIANQSNYGLDASVFTQDIDKAIYVAKNIESGSVTINTSPAHGVGIFPFGGDKDSGIGREGLNYSIDEMTKLHTIVFNMKK
ncbi:MAG: aldehyde dehydrogenase family protein, partial [Candidatus Aenigmatarchaeota archaeon]